MSDSDSILPESWISSFCSLLGHEYFAEVSEDFIEDDFNLTGLQNQVPMYKEALEMILDVEPEEDEDEEEEEDDDDSNDDDDDGTVMRDEQGKKITGEYRRAGQKRHYRLDSDLSVIEGSAELLYGLIHQRYITSRQGIQQMLDKYELQHFGTCPRVFCNQAKVLPVGCHDTPGIDTVKLFCPSCLDVFTPPNSRFQSVDGAFFGTTFGCLFFMTFPDLNVSPQGDPLKLASTNPIFAPQGSSAAALAAGSPSTTTVSTPSSSSAHHLTSSSSPDQTLVTTPVSPNPSNSANPLPPQPSSINGINTTNLAPGLGSGKIHEPRIYGFRVSERAKTGPRMKWLRLRPADIRELDEAGKYYALYGGDGESGEGEGDDGQNGAATAVGGANGATGQSSKKAVAPGSRKKAVARRRRGVGAGGG